MNNSSEPGKQTVIEYRVSLWCLGRAIRYFQAAAVEYAFESKGYGQYFYMSGYHAAIVTEGALKAFGGAKRVLCHGEDE